MSRVERSKFGSMQVSEAHSRLHTPEDCVKSQKEDFFPLYSGSFSVTEQIFIKKDPPSLAVNLSKNHTMGAWHDFTLTWVRFWFAQNSSQLNLTFMALISADIRTKALIK